MKSFFRNFVLQNGELCVSNNRSLPQKAERTAKTCPTTGKPQNERMSKETVTSVFVKLRSRFMQRARGVLPSQEDAEDALQDAFVRLWQKAETLNTEQEVEAVATTTLRHLGIDRYRRGQRLATVELDGTHDRNEEEETDSDQRNEQMNEVEQLMEEVLSPSQRKIIQLHEYEERSYEEVAMLMGMQQTAVRMQLSRARKALREEYRRIHNSK